MSAVFSRFGVEQCKFGAKLAAADRAQVPQSDDSCKTESQSSLKQDSMQGWEQENDLAAAAKRTRTRLEKKQNRQLGFP